jgi:hypothetical protein
MQYFVGKHPENGVCLKNPPAVDPKTHMAAKYLRKNIWWVRFHHPHTGALLRASLETQDVARAELLRQRRHNSLGYLPPHAFLDSYFQNQNPR